MFYDFYAYDTVKNGKPLLYRFLEILPGMAVLVFFMAVLVLSFVAPVWVAVFIILFDLYWLLKITYLTMHLVLSYQKLRRNVSLNWLAKVKATKAKRDWKRLRHLVIVPFAIESIEILRPTFKALINSNYPLHKMIVVLAGEARTWDRIGPVAEAIENEFGHTFGHFMVTKHPANTPGEIPGKGSNQTYAGKQAKKYIDEQGLAYENVVVSVLDCDTVLHPEYFGCLTWHYITVDRPTRTSYQPVPVFHNNLWDAPSIMRVVASSTSFWQLMEQGRPERLATFTSHSMSFQTVVDIGFWSVDAVSEDSRVFWQCYVHYKSDYHTTPMMFPVSMDACLADSYLQSLRNQYKQQRRWAWGSENMPFVVYSFLTNGKGIALSKRFAQSIRLFDDAFSWATSAIVVAVVGWLPLLFGGQAFEGTVFAQSLPRVTQILVTLAMVGLFGSIIISTLIMPHRPRNYSFFRSIAMVLQWLLLPIATIVFGSIPAIDALMRLMVGKYMGFWVTPKARKSDHVPKKEAVM